MPNMLRMKIYSEESKRNKFMFMRVRESRRICWTVRGRYTIPQTTTELPELNDTTLQLKGIEQSYF